MDSGIYMLRNKVNNKFYIGKSVRLRIRRNEHRIAGNLRGRVLARAFKKYGKDNFEFIVLERCEPERLFAREVHYIATLQPEYNMTEGGDGRRGPMPEEAKAVLAERGRAQWANKTDDERARVVSHNLTGPRKGHQVGLDTRQKLRVAATKQHRERGPSALQKQAASASMKAWHAAGHPPVRARAVVQIDPQTREVLAVFPMATEAASALGVHPSGITGVCRGRKKTCAGYAWAYASVKV